MPYAPRTPIAKMVEKLQHERADQSTILRAIEAAELIHSVTGQPPVAKRGTRIPFDWHPSPGLVSYAERSGLDQSRIRLEVEKFKNYWTAKAGAGAVKRDWSATWRNWILTATESRHAPSHNRFTAVGASPTSRPTKSGADAVLAGMGRLANRLSQGRTPARCTERETVDDADIARDLDVDGGGT